MLLQFTGKRQFNRVIGLCRTPNTRLDELRKCPLRPYFPASFYPLAMVNVSEAQNH